MSQVAPLENVATEYCTRFRLQFHTKCGEGAFKQTFKVTDVDGTTFALKVHKPGMSSLRTTRELDAMRKCSHPNIARLIRAESFSFCGTVYLVTIEEFLSGGTLSACGKLSAERGFDVGSQLIDAVAHIASVGLVHRDLKPDSTDPLIRGIITSVMSNGISPPNWVATRRACSPSSASRTL
jgi:serine/threonine protein kinase